MSVRPLPLHQIQIQNSPYTFVRIDSLNEAILRSCFESENDSELASCLDPIVVHEASANVYNLMQGFQRIRHFQSKGIAEVSAFVFPSATAPETILDFVCAAHFEAITHSIISRIRFLDLGLKLGVPRKTLIEKILPLLGLEGHEAVLRKCEAVARLPEPILQFCHEKKFSLRQCAHLTHHSRELLDTVFAWRKNLHLTASLADELLTHIHDCLRAAKITLNEFLAHPEITALLQSSLDPQQKTESLRLAIRKRRFPVLSETHAKMEAAVNAMAAPKTVQLRWDPSLEIREVTATVKVKSLEEWNEAVSRLSSEETAKGIEKLLQEL